jgi:glucose/arabinose dehydrogenase
MKKIYALIITSILLAWSHSYGITLPAGFTSVSVGTVYYPTAMAVAPDGRIFMTEKAGRVKIFKNGAVLSTPFYQVTVEQTNERGLGGIVLDPNFATNHYVYIYYTVPGSNVHNRLSRITANGDVAVPGSEVILLELENVVNSIHNGGGMVFGPDGKLYLGVGDDQTSSNAQNLNTHKGKILRLNKDGSSPADNPYFGSTVARRVWAYGFRNPYTLAISSSGKIFANDVGEGAWEEVNDVTTGNKNFGWPGSEGYTTNPSYTSPYYAYAHGAGALQGCAITGGAFLKAGTTNYPAMYHGKFFYIDYCNKWINYIDPNGTPNPTTFASALSGSASNVIQGADGNLYYFLIGGNSLNKIMYTSNNPPTIVSQPSSITRAVGQSATFSVTASGAQPLAYQWKKNGVNITGANAASYTIASVQASSAGNYSCYVSNSYGNVTSNNATLTVSTNQTPTAQVLYPANGAIYRAGQTINFSGSGSDPEDGNLPASKLSWIVEFHHDAHIHPGPSIAPGTASGSFLIPNTGETSSNVYYRIKLIATDNGGLTDTAYVDIFPKKSNLILASQPAGLTLNLDGQPHPTPFSQMQVSGLIRQISAPSPQSLNGTYYVFSHWAHGGTATQNITISDVDRTVTAVYTISTTTTNDSLIRVKDMWKYLDNGTNQGTAWKERTFSDSNWPSGKAQLGYGDGDEGKVVSFGPNASNKYITTYFRKSFNITNPADYSALKLSVLRDDGVIVYLNGTEVFRDNMPSGTITNTSLALTGVDGTAESQFLNAIISSNLLVAGTNVIAAEVHQSYAASSDLSFDLTLTKSASTPCTAIQGLFASNITTSTAVLNWTAQGSSSYNIRYRPAGASVWTNTTRTTNSANITGLNAGMRYEFQVQGVCSGSSTSFSPSAYFNTLNSSSDCAKPYGLSSTSITSTTATLKWGTTTNATSYNIQYRKTGSSTWSLSTVNTNSLNLTGLIPSSQYEFQLQTNCGANRSSFTALAYFTTKPSGQRTEQEADSTVATGVQKDISLNVYPNPFSYETNISFKLDTVSAVRIDVIDITGRLVHQFDEISMRQEEGEYTFSFVPSDLGLTPGIYIVRLTINNSVTTRKISFSD